MTLKILVHSYIALNEGRPEYAAAFLLLINQHDEAFDILERKCSADIVTKAKNLHRVQ